jgi:hypothetical protein
MFLTRFCVGKIKCKLKFHSGFVLFGIHSYFYAREKKFPLHVMHHHECSRTFYFMLDRFSFCLVFQRLDRAVMLFIFAFRPCDWIRMPNYIGRARPCYWFWWWLSLSTALWQNLGRVLQKLGQELYAHVISDAKVNTNSCQSALTKVSLCM